MTELSQWAWSCDKCTYTVAYAGPDGSRAETRQAHVVVTDRARPGEPDTIKGTCGRCGADVILTRTA